MLLCAASNVMLTDNSIKSRLKKLSCSKSTPCLMCYTCILKLIFGLNLKKNWTKGPD